MILFAAPAVSRADLNNSILKLVEKVTGLKQLLLSDAAAWDLHVVAAACKSTAVGIRDYGQQVDEFNQGSSWKIPADKFDQVIQAARDFITYAQTCCRTRTPDDDEIHRLANALSAHIRAVVAMERESRAVFAAAPAPSKNPFASAKPAAAPTPVASTAKAYAPPVLVQPKPAAPASSSAPAGGGDRISDLFADVVPPGQAAPKSAPQVVLPPSSTYGDIGQIHSSRPAAAPAALADDDELDSLLDGLEAGAPAAATNNAAAGSSAVNDDLDLLTADLGTPLYSTQKPASSGATSAESELDDLLNDL